MINERKPRKRGGHETVMPTRIRETFTQATAQGKTPEVIFDALSPRKREIAELIVAGQSYTQIGEALGMKQASVRKELTGIHRSLRGDTPQPIPVREGPELTPEYIGELQNKVTAMTIPEREELTPAQTYVVDVQKTIKTRIEEGETLADIMKGLTTKQKNLLQDTLGVSIDEATTLGQLGRHTGMKYQNVRGNFGTLLRKIVKQTDEEAKEKTNTPSRESIEDLLNNGADFEALIALLPLRQAEVLINAYDYEKNRWRVAKDIAVDTNLSTQGVHSYMSAAATKLQSVDIQTVQQQPRSVAYITKLINRGVSLEELGKDLLPEQRQILAEMYDPSTRQWSTQEEVAQRLGTTRARINLQLIDAADALLYIQIMRS